jgi:hypothetical protein
MGYLTQLGHAPSLSAARLSHTYPENTLHQKKARWGSAFFPSAEWFYRCVLHAYDATNLSWELCISQAGSRDQFGAGLLTWQSAREGDLPIQ